MYSLISLVWVVVLVTTSTHLINMISQIAFTYVAYATLLYGSKGLKIALPCKKECNNELFINKYKFNEKIKKNIYVNLIKVSNMDNISFGINQVLFLAILILIFVEPALASKQGEKDFKKRLQEPQTLKKGGNPLLVKPVNTKENF